MIRKLLFCATLLSLAQGSQAQGSNCGLAVAKSGTGLVKNYTFSTQTSAPSAYQFNIWPSNLASITGTGASRTVTYSYGGVYYFYLAANNCTDSIYTTDTIVGPMQCGINASTLSATTNSSTRTATFTTTANSVSAPGIPPGYTSTVTYLYGDGTSGTSNTHTYNTLAGTIIVKAATTYSHPQFGSCTDTALTTIWIPYVSCNPSIVKSGTGFTRTYTVQSSAANPTYNLNVYRLPLQYTSWGGIPSVATSSNTALVHTYAQPGYYQIDAHVTSAACYDSVGIYDTVLGAVNCAALTHGLSAYNYSGGNAGFSVYGTAQDTYPGYTASTTFDYGDGTTGTSSSHTYTNPGNYLVTATTVLTHPTYGTCTVVDTATARVGVPGFNCANAHASFTYTNSGATYTFNNTSSYPTTSGVSVSYQWSSNGGFSATGLGSKTYTFWQNGTYNVWLKATWTGNGMVLCRDSVMHTITVNSYPPPPNKIYVNAVWDSGQNAAGASIKFWLIQYDSTTQMLSAVDSSVVALPNGWSHWASTEFSGKPAANYLLKAHMISQPTSWTTGFLPTYDSSAAYWSSARAIPHGGGTTYSDVYLLQGTPMTGPGFISGSVLQGANKGTAVGDPMGNITILLRNNANNKLVASAETDANGQFTFTGVPVGSYNIYPEELNYTTTPSASIQITATNTNSTANDFWRETVAKTLHPITPSGVKAVQEEGQILISPNPAKEYLNLQFTTAPQQGSTVQLYNGSGQLVKSFEISNAQTSQQLSLSGIAAGNYWLHISTATGKQVTQITIQP